MKKEWEAKCTIKLATVTVPYRFEKGWIMIQYFGDPHAYHAVDIDAGEWIGYVDSRHGETKLETLGELIIYVNPLAKRLRRSVIAKIRKLLDARPNQLTLEVS